MARGYRITLAEIAAAMGVSREAAAARARKSCFPYVEEPVRGGWRRLYRFRDLPGDIQRALTQRAEPAQGRSIFCWFWGRFLKAKTTKGANP